MRQRVKEQSKSVRDEKPAVVRPEEELDRFVEAPGAFFLTIVLFFVPNLFWYFMEVHTGDEIGAIYAILNDPMQGLIDMFPMPTYEAAAIYLGFWVLSILLHYLIPGEIVMGQPQTHNGVRLPYLVNGKECFIVSIVALLGTTYYGYFDPSLVVDHFGPIATLATTFSYGICVLLYLRGYLFYEGNPSGNLVLDYFYGYEANPRFFGQIWLDPKWITEGRALMAWTLIEMCFLHTAYVRTGVLPSAMLLTTVLHFLYVLHYFIHETAVLTMLDFYAENFGIMLCWGNMTWVMITFTFPVVFLYHYSGVQELSAWGFAGIFLLWGFGYIIFAQTCIQKFQFKKAPEQPIWGRVPEFISADRGRKLLISGWWGIGRKMNYTGDLIMAWANGLPSYALRISPFLYGCYLTVLLIHRLHRDERWCAKKYKQYWKAYCEKVPYRLIPYVY